MGVLRTGSPRLTNTWNPSAASSQGGLYPAENLGPYSLFPLAIDCMVRCLPLFIQQSSSFPTAVGGWRQLPFPPGQGSSGGS